MKNQWIDTTSGLAYITVHGHMTAFIELLDAIDRLVARPTWKPGTPIIEDLRDYQGCSPPNCVEQWRSYVAERGRVLCGSRWAVVRRDEEPSLLLVLDMAAKDAVPHGVV